MKILIFWLSYMFVISFPIFGIDKSRELENQRLELIKASLNEKNIAYEERSLFASQGGFGKSIHIVFPPADNENRNRAEQFLLAIPLSTINDTQNIKRFDIETALHIAEQLQNGTPPIPVRIAFLGDEYSSLPRDISSIRNIGLADLLSLYDTPENVIVVYLDAASTSDKLIIHHGSNGNVVPLNILKPLTDSFEKHDISFSLFVKYNELYKLRLIQSEETLEKFQSMDFPGLSIRGNAENTNRVSAELEKDPETEAKAFALGEAIIDYIFNIEVSSENYDTHYFFFTFFHKVFYFSEVFTVLSFLAISLFSFILFFLYSLTHRHILLIQSKVFLKRSWIIMLHFLILTGSIFASNAIYFLMREMLHIPDFHTDYLSILIKLFIALCFYNLCVPIFYRIWIPRKDRFYGNSAVTLVIIGTIIAAFLDITFVPIFLWSFIFTLLGTIITNPWLVLLCTIAVPLQIGGAFINIIVSDSHILATIIASNNIYVTLFIACITLPEILMANRIVLLFRRGQSDNSLKKRTIQQLIIIGISILLFAGMGIFMTNQVPPSPFRKTVTENSDSYPQVLRAALTSTEYLDRRVFSLSINALGNPAKFNVSIGNENPNMPLVIYDAPVPFERQDEDNTLVFHLGERPENPFTMEIVLPSELQGKIFIEALYSTWDSNIDPERPLNTEDYATSYTLLIPIL